MTKITQDRPWQGMLGPRESRSEPTKQRASYAGSSGNQVQSGVLVTRICLDAVLEFASRMTFGNWFFTFQFLPGFRNSADEFT
jgi:hypothetical protein